MTPAIHEALRIALAFTAALVAAEMAEIELTFVAPLVAGTLMVNRTRPGLVLLLPVLAFGLCLVSALLAELGGRLPALLLLLLAAGFWLGFRLSRRTASAPAALVLLVVLAALPDAFLRQPEAVEQVTRWLVANTAIASAAVLLVALLLPARTPDPPPATPDPPLPDAVAALALLLVTAAAWAAETDALLPFVASVIVLLRADGGLRSSARDRLGGALAGGALALAATLLTELSPSLAMLAAATMLCVWPIARAAAEAGRWRGAAAKGLIAMALLHGQGLSELYEDTDERFGIRLAGVIAGLLVGAALVALLRPRPAAAERTAPQRG